MIYYAPSNFTLSDQARVWTMYNRRKVYTYSNEATTHEKHLRLGEPVDVKIN